MLATRRTGVQVDLEGTIHSDDPEDIVGKGDGVGLRGEGVVSVGKLLKTMMAQLTHQRKTSGSRVEGRVEQDESRREESDEGTCDVTVDRKPAVGLPEEKEGRTKPADRGSVAVLETGCHSVNSGSLVVVDEVEALLGEPSRVAVSADGGHSVKDLGEGDVYGRPRDTL